MEKNTPMHIREYGGFLAGPEKKALLWLAQKTPRSIHSDHLTLLGLVAMLLAGASYWAASRNKFALIVVVLSLAANWLGDSLDGTLARVRNKLRPRYGFYVDHMVDAFGALFLLAGLALSGYMSERVALLGGKFRVESQLNRGTKVSITLPLRRETRD